jgi:hypothetical protein
MNITHTDILWILNLACYEADLTPWGSEESLDKLATRIRGVLRAKYEPLVFNDAVECKHTRYHNGEVVSVDYSIF